MLRGQGGSCGRGGDRAGLQSIWKAAGRAPKAWGGWVSRGQEGRKKQVPKVGGH